VVGAWYSPTASAATRTCGGSWPEFEGDFKVVLFDQVGAGGSDLSAYDTAKYWTLHGYADDVVEIGRALGLTDAVFVGHSVSAMIGVLALASDLFGRTVLVGPSAGTSTTATTRAASTRSRSRSFWALADDHYDPKTSNG
jgi:pimeloyl-ACP methyl ester carboxylesterase